MSQVFIYDNGRKCFIKTQKYKNASHIKEYKRLTGNTYFNPKTQKEEQYNYKELQVATKVYAKAFGAYMNLLENFEGNNTEKLLENRFDREIRTTKELSRIYKNFLQKLIRRLPPVIIGKFWLFDDKYKPRLHLWIKSQGNEELIIDPKMLSKIWEEGEIKVIEITKENRVEKAKYYERKNCLMDFYPPKLQIFELFPKDKVKIVDSQEVQRAIAEQEMKRRRMQMTYGDTKPTNATVNGREETLQVTTYEDFEQQKVKLSKTTKAKKYKRIKNQGGKIK
jgi:hypothetical protein